MKNNPLYFLISVVFFSLIVSCGRMGPPRPPEAFRPKEVVDLRVIPDTSGITLRWNSPDNDVRNEELKSMDGYWIEKVEMEDPDADILVLASDEEIFSRVGDIEDLHVVTREKLRDEARLQGRSAKKINLDPAFKSFSFIDNELSPGGSYLYRIVPYNQGDVRGVVGQIVRVNFRGSSSEVTFVNLTSGSQTILDPASDEALS